MVGCSRGKLQLIGWLLQLWGLSRGMQRGTWSQAPVIRRNHSFLQSLALVMRARMLGVRAQTVKVEACVCKSATKHHLAVAWLHWPNQPNTDLLHVLGLAPTGLALWCDPGSSGKRTNQALSARWTGSGILVDLCLIVRLARVIASNQFSLRIRRAQSLQGGSTGCCVIPVWIC